MISEFKEQGVQVKIMGWNGKNFKFLVNNLHSPIKPTESTVKQTGSGLVITLIKAKSEHWDSLEKKASLVII